MVAHAGASGEASHRHIYANEKAMVDADTFSNNQQGISDKVMEAFDLYSHSDAQITHKKVV